MLYSRAGNYPADQPMLFAEDFSPNTVQGACPRCHGIGRVYEVPEALMVPDPSLTIRDRAIASWPTAWHGQNQRDILVSLGYDVDKPWKDLSKKDRNWILYTEERPTVPVYAGLTPAQTRRAVAQGMEPSYQGTFVGARRYVLDTFANTKSASVKKRVSQFVSSAVCPTCHGKLLKPEALSVTFEGFDIAELSALPLTEFGQVLAPVLGQDWTPIDVGPAGNLDEGARRAAVQHRVAAGGSAHKAAPDIRHTPNMSVEKRAAAGLHPRDRDALLGILQGLKRRGNSVFVVEHSLDIIGAADWLVDIGPGAGENGGRILYSGPPDGLAEVPESATRGYLFGVVPPVVRIPRQPDGWLQLEHVSRNNLHDVSVSFPLRCLTAVTGVSGAGKSSLVSQALPTLVADYMGSPVSGSTDDASDDDLLLSGVSAPVDGRIVGDIGGLRRVVCIDQKPIGRTPRSNVATYTGMFDHIRRRFAETPEARRRGYNAGRFSFNVASGRCPTCEGEGWVMVELLFLPSVYTPCPDCHGSRYKASTLEITWRDRNIAEILQMSVEQAREFFDGDSEVLRSLTVLCDVGLGYLRLGQPATELSGGEAQRVKLASELQRAHRGDALYLLDEPTAGLHSADTDRLMLHLQKLVDVGNTVVVVELDMRVVAQADYVIDLGPGAGAAGGRIVATGTPAAMSTNTDSPTAPYLAAAVDLPPRRKA
jgi:excinuclease ABC subunit A